MLWLCVNSREGNFSEGFFLNNDVCHFLPLIEVFESSWSNMVIDPLHIVNHSIFWFEVLLIQNFAFLVSYHFILMFVFSILYSKSCKYLQLFSAHSASMTSMQLLPVVIIQYAKYEIHHLELD